VPSEPPRAGQGRASRSIDEQFAKPLDPPTRIHVIDIDAPLGGLRRHDSQAVAHLEIREETATDQHPRRPFGDPRLHRRRSQARFNRKQMRTVAASQPVRLPSRGRCLQLQLSRLVAALRSRPYNLFNRYFHLYNVWLRDLTSHELQARTAV
jgi:hypothetical protein